MSATDHLWHPWLRIQRVLRVMLKTWNEETWQHIKPEVADALKERSRLVRSVQLRAAHITNRSGGSL